MTPAFTVRLAAGKDKKVRTFYPWVLRDDIQDVKGEGESGLCRIVSTDGKFIGVGTYHSTARIAARILSRVDVPMDQTFFVEKFKRCLAKRDGILEPGGGCRVVYAEADDVPGLLVDLYDGHAVVQVRTAGLEMLKPAWLPALQQVFKTKSIFERSDMSGRADEGLEPVKQVLAGSPPNEVWFEENGLKVVALIKHGLKTGYYLDQRDARSMMRAWVAPGEKVLDCFCYTGGFAMAAAAEGAQVRGVDVNPLALEAADKAAKLNGLEIDFVEANVFDYVGDGAEGGGPYDWIILDPPAISKTKEARDSLKWGLHKLVTAAIPLLRPHGHLVVFACTFQMGQRELMEVCRLAAAECNVKLNLEQVTHQPLDHPIPLHFPEAHYLKGLWLRKDD